MTDREALGRIWYRLGTFEFWLMNWPHTGLVRRRIGALRSWMWWRQARRVVQITRGAAVWPGDHRWDAWGHDDG